VAFLSKLFLNVPDTPLSNAHSSYLAPFFSVTSVTGLLSSLTALANDVTAAEPDDKTAQQIARNFDEWGDGLYQTAKELLLIALEKKSRFVFDITHWIAHVTKLLALVASAPACSRHSGDELRRHADWLISTLSFVPDDEESISFAENYGMTETLFDVAWDAHHYGWEDLSRDIRDLIFSWAFNAAKHQTGWRILERAIYALATLVVATGHAQLRAPLVRKIAARLEKDGAASQDVRDDTARAIRENVAARTERPLALSRIDHAMTNVDREALETLLVEIANVLSPATAEEPVDTGLL
jgi:hypothetical protein